MFDSRIGRVAQTRHGLNGWPVSAAIFLFVCALLLVCELPAVWAQEGKAAPPPTNPSPGKALVYIYRVGRFTGSAAHDHLYVNGVYLAYLKNSEYAGTEVNPGPVVVTGSTEMYYAGGVAMSSYAEVKNSTKKENERIRLDVEAGKAYYLKWTSEPLGSGVKVTLMDPAVGAKEMSKLHLSKPVEQPEDKSKETAK